MSRRDLTCAGCGDDVHDGIIDAGDVWCRDCASDLDPDGEHYDELDGGRDRVAVRDRYGCVVVTDPHMALWISECAE